MTILPPEDAVCPYCPADNAYTLRDVGPKIESERRDGDRIRVTFRRPAWELSMLDHLRVKHNARWRAIMAQMAAEHAGVRTEQAQAASRDAARTIDPLIEQYKRETEAGL